MAKNKSVRDQTVAALGNELRDLEGINTQNPETGAGIGQNKSYLKYYTNRVFGSPYQLLDSVDRRFEEINSYLGNEYLRNIILNSSILHIRPGMPKYTGGGDNKGLLKKLKYIYMDTKMGGMPLLESMFDNLLKDTLFSRGSKMQRRMFGFRETYYEYMQHVNYMCRSVAVFMNLINSEEKETEENEKRFPSGAIGSNGYEEFSTMRWENYRMMRNSKSSTPLNHLTNILGAYVDGPINIIKSIGKSAIDCVTNLLDDFSNPSELIQEFNGGNANMNAVDSLEEAARIWIENFSDDELKDTLVGDVVANKISSVEFMVNPTTFTESYTNTTRNSMIEDAVDSLSNSAGAELRFIANSKADVGMIDDITKFLGDVTTTAVQFAAGITEGVTGGFTTNLFSGAMRSIKGQKMIYPKIYQSSESSMDYEFTMRLTTPYGDPYNYYMNIVVPLLHLIALVAPRMVTSNTVTSPYLVQAYIPGQCTCQLGIIRSLMVRKNPESKHVSVNGFPLTVDVTFTIEELYNAMSISPANDPSSFLFNETLSDYMSNIAGLLPSMDTYTRQRKEMFKNMESYLKGEWVNDGLSPFVEELENFINPFTGR